MARAKTPTGKPQSSAQPDRQQGDKLGAAVAKVAAPPVARNATIGNDNADKQSHRNLGVPETYKSPTTGRNTKLGKKVEKPADPKPGGPSGQTDRAKHNKRHANK